MLDLTLLNDGASLNYRNSNGKKRIQALLDSTIHFLHQFKIWYCRFFFIIINKKFQLQFLCNYVSCPDVRSSYFTWLEPLLLWSINLLKLSVCSISSQFGILKVNQQYCQERCQHYLNCFRDDTSGGNTLDVNVEVKIMQRQHFPSGVFIDNRNTPQLESHHI